jgi:hypothetical protein
VPYPNGSAQPVYAKHPSSAPGHSSSSPLGHRRRHEDVTSSHDVPQKNPNCTSVNSIGSSSLTFVVDTDKLLVDDDDDDDDDVVIIVG